MGGEVGERHVVAREDVALAHAALLLREHVPFGAVVDVDDAEGASAENRYFLVQELLDDLARGRRRAVAGAEGHPRIDDDEREPRAGEAKRDALAEILRERVRPRHVPEVEPLVLVAAKADGHDGAREDDARNPCVASREQDGRRPLDVDAEERLGVGRPELVDGREVVERARALEAAAHQRLVRDVAVGDLDVEPREVSAVRARLDERAHFAPAREERAHDGAPDEPRRAGHGW